MQDRSDVPYDRTLCTKSGYELLEMFAPELQSRRHMAVSFREPIVARIAKVAFK
jgi:hypothetical protein